MSGDLFFSGVNEMGRPVEIRMSDIDRVMAKRLEFVMPKDARTVRTEPRHYDCATCGEDLHRKECRCRYTARCSCGAAFDMTEPTADAALAEAQCIHYGPGIHEVTVHAIER